MAGRAAKRLAVLLTVVVLVAGALHAGVWFWGVALLERGVAAQLDALRAQGWTVSSTGQVRSGWPVAVALDLSGVVATHPSTAGDVTWRAGQLRVEITALHPGTVVLLPGGPQAVRVGRTPEVPFNSGGLRAEVALDRPERVHLVATTLHAAAPYDVQLQGVDATLAPESVALAARQVVLPEGVPWALGRQLEAVTLEATWPGVMERPGATRLVVQNMALRWGPLWMAGRGTAALDRAQGVTVGGTMRVRGAPETVAALRSAGVLNPNQATAASAILGLLLRGAGPGGEVEVPISLQDGVVSVSRVPLVRLPPPPWLGQ